MDLDDLDGSSQAPSRVSRFAPKSSKLKPKPKSEPQEPLPKPESQPPLSNIEPHAFDSVTAKRPDDEETETLASACNGAMKIDFEPKLETGDESKLETGDEAKNDDPMDVDGNGEDRVMREIDVFFNPSIDVNTQIYVLQYPLRPSWRPYEIDDRCEEVRLKPSSSEVELDLSINFDSDNYDKDSKIKMTKQTLSSAWQPPCGKGYAVGILTGNQLHLHPIHAVVQLRSSFEHLNSSGSKKKNAISTSANSGVKIEEPIEEKPAIPLKKQTKQMGSSIEQKSNSDKNWVTLKYHGSKSDNSSRYLQQMLAQDHSSISFTMSPSDYVTSLCPGESNNIKAKGLTKRDLQLLPPVERVKKLLIEGPPLLRFSFIKHHVPEYSEEELFEYLQQHAILVQGLWVAKTSLLCFQSPIENLARDIALVLFSKDLKVQLPNLKPDLSKCTRNFLNIFGVESKMSSKSMAQAIVYWKFRENCDKSFIKRYPKIVEKQEIILKNIESKLQPIIANKDGKREPAKSAGAKFSLNNRPGQPLNSDKQVTSAVGVPPGKMTMSSETRQALPSALKKILQTHKVCSFQMIREQLRQSALSQSSLAKSDPKSKMVVAASQASDAPPEELQAVISEVACNIHGYYVLKSSQDDPFRDVVIDLLRGSGPNAQLKKAEIQEAARRKLNRDIPYNEYIKVMGELCKTKGSVWILKSGDGSER